MDYSQPTECEMIVATADVAFFCKACQDKPDLETFKMLDEFYTLVTSTVARAGGTVIKFMGDAALIVFPKDKAKQAVAALRDLKSQAQSLWSAFNARCEVRTRAHVGSVVAGPIGPERRLDVIGTTLNELFRMPWDGPELSEQLRKILEQ